MKIVITGASGNVGKTLAKSLSRKDVELLLVGRDTKKLIKIFPENKCCDYHQFEKSSVLFDAIIHLAAINNNNRCSSHEFKKINVDFLNSIAMLAVKKKIKFFINFNSFHSLDEKNKSYYAESKREGSRKISKFKNIKIINLYLPYIKSGVWRGKLSFLNLFPEVLAKLVFNIFSAIKPSVNMDTIIKKIISLINTNSGGEFLVAEDINKNYIYRLFSKTVDFIFVISVLFLIPFLLIVYFVILITERNNPIFSQKRVGKKKSIFICYKFRTMNKNAPEKSTHELNSKYITKLGKIIRKLKIDELPQALNIFKGEMTLIGPRPCLISQKELIENRSNLKVYNILPGITGLSQINGIDMSNPKALAESDNRYQKLRCIYLDIKIILMTILRI